VLTPMFSQEIRTAGDSFVVRQKFGFDSIVTVLPILVWLMGQFLKKKQICYKYKRCLFTTRHRL
jgi:hypothetical protein